MKPFEFGNNFVDANPSIDLLIEFLVESKLKGYKYVDIKVDGLSCSGSPNSNEEHEIENVKLITI